MFTHVRLIAFTITVFSTLGSRLIADERASVPSPYYLRDGIQFSPTEPAPKVTAEAQAAVLPSEKDRLRELDAYWAEISRTVSAGDFEGYKATCHEQGVLVSGIKKTSQPLANALVRWKQGFDDTKAGKMKANVTFRFSTRLGDADTAHETGIFLYTTETPEGNCTEEYIHLEALLTRQEGKWAILMEYQKSKATMEEWESLK